MRIIKAFIKRVVPRKIFRNIREGVAYWRSRYYANPNSVRKALGDVSPEWRRRIDNAIACPDNAFIPRVPEAGRIDGGLVTMHNGIRVSALGYYGSGPMNMLVENRGVHEPQEERAFAEVLRYIPSGGTIVELGAYWGFYSLWFAQVVAGAKCLLIEPVDENIRSGILNFRRAGCNAIFERAFIGASNGNASNSTPIVTLDTFCKRNGIEHISLLHADIQGAELDMLRGARLMLTEKRIDYVFISTHSNVLHYECVSVLRSHDYIVLASADLDETYSFDGVVVAKSKEMENPQDLPMSKKPRALSAAKKT